MRRVLLPLVVLLSACSTSPATPPVADTPAPAATTSATTPTTATTRPSTTPSTRAVRLPPPAARADYQLGGPYAPAADVRIVVRDRTVAPAPGTYGVCYVNAFQTQPGEAGDHPGLLLRAGGRVVTDPGYPDEALFDLRTPQLRAALAAVVGGWLDGCARSGYAGAELDNLDSWTRSDGAFGAEQAQAYARLLTARAHAAGLAVAQKNAAELAPGARARLGFDFAVAEECGVYDECDAYTDEYGGRVLEVEYTDNGEVAYARACRTRSGALSIQLRDRDLVPAGSPGHVARTC